MWSDPAQVWIHSSEIVAFGLGKVVLVIDWSDKQMIPEAWDVHLLLSIPEIYNLSCRHCCVSCQQVQINEFYFHKQPG